MLAAVSDRPKRVPASTTGASLGLVLAGLLCLLQLSGACSTSSEGARPAQSAAQAHTAAQPQAAASSGEQATRALASDAPFSELVRAVRTLAQRGDTHASADCVLSDTSHGYRLEAELMLALDVLPDPPVELDALLQHDHGPLALVTGWGVLGVPDASLVLTSFTATAPQRLRAPPAALVLTDQGAYLRTGARAALEGDGPLPPEGALQRLQADPLFAASPLFVSAEAGIPLSALAALLQALPPERSVAFAVALPSGTRLPAQSIESAQLACPNGLPEVDPERPEGEIDARALSAALQALQPETERCLSNASGAGRAGGAFTLALRIAAGGSAEDACILAGDVRDPSLIACVLQAVRAARFPKPSPAGFVDVHVPLRLEPTGWPEPRPYCAAKAATPPSP